MVCYVLLYIHIGRSTQQLGLYLIDINTFHDPLISGIHVYIFISRRDERESTCNSFRRLRLARWR